MCVICQASQAFDPLRHEDSVSELLFANVNETSDAPFGTSTGYEISVDDSFTGEIETAGDIDWIEVNLSAGTTYEFDLEGSSSGGGTLADPYIEIYDGDGNYITWNDDGGTGFDSLLSYTAAESGTYYLSVATFGSATGTYTLYMGEGDPPANGTIEEMAEQLTSGYWGLDEGDFYLWDTSSSNEITVDLSGLTAEGQQLARWALEAWELVADLDFVEVNSGADIVFDDEDSGAYAAFFSSGSNITSAEVNVDDSWIDDYGATIDSYAFSTYIHEIGHAIGLGHQGNYNGNAAYPADALFLNDSTQLSIMSYFSQTDNTLVDADYAEPITPMMVDVFAVHGLYGESTVTAGNTIWGQDSNLPGFLGDYFRGAADNNLSSDFYDGNAIAFTITDTGGNDLVDFDYLTSDTNFDMREQGISDVDGLTGNVAISEGTIIEALNTGSGNDDITGNSAGNEIRANGGNDVIRSGAGADSVFGGNGSDTIFGANASDSLVGGNGADSLNGGGGNDTLLGGGGADTIRGGGGNDQINGGKGQDLIHLQNGADLYVDVGQGGTGGRDRVFGGKGNDTIEGGGGNDLFNGGGGRDDIAGGSGADTLVGGDGADTLRGGNGADDVTGGKGADLILMGGGADTFTDTAQGGAGGMDTITGGAGADTFIFSNNISDNAITDFDADADMLHLSTSLWGGGLSESEVVEDLASVTDDGVLLDFGSNGSILLEDLTSTDGLADALTLL